MKKRFREEMNKFDNEIKRKLKDLEVEPPQEIWSAIENRLDNKQKAPVFFWRKFAAAAALLILLVSASVFYFSRLFTSPQVADSAIPSADSDQTSTKQTLSPQNKEATKIIASVGDDMIASHNQLLSDRENATAKNSASTTNEKVLPTHENGFVETPSFHILEKLPSLTSYINTYKLPNNRIVLAFNSPVSNTPNRLKTIITDQNNDLAFSMASSALSISGYFAPQQSYRFQYGSGSSGFSESLESEIMSFATGLNINYKLNNRWELQSGLGYNIIGQRVNDIASFSHPSMMPLYSNDGNTINSHPQRMSTSMGGIVFTDQSLYFADVSSTRIITLKGSYDESIVNLLNKNGTGLIQQFEYLELPLSARYKLFEYGVTVYAKAGVIANYLLSGKVYLMDNMPSDNPIGHSVGISKFNFTGMSGLAFSYPLTNRMQLNLEPTATMFFRPMGQVRNLTNKTYPYSWSVYMGVSYKL